MKILMMAVCACVCAVGAFAETTEAYVKDGLIAMWDGWENDGAGGHATELSEWKDTTGTYSFAFDENSGITVDGAALVFPSAQAGGATLSADDTAATFNLARSGTLEIVMISDPTTAGSKVIQSSSTSGIGFGAGSRSSATANVNLYVCTDKRNGFSVLVK